jgi:hypothetical protein
LPSSVFELQGSDRSESVAVGGVCKPSARVDGNRRAWLDIVANTSRLFLRPRSRIPFDVQVVAWFVGAALTWHPFWQSIEIVTVVYWHLPYPAWLPY